MPTNMANLFFIPDKFIYSHLMYFWNFTFKNNGEFTLLTIQAIKLSLQVKQSLTMLLSYKPNLLAIFRDIEY